MREEAVKRFLAALGVSQSAMTKRQGRGNLTWINCICVTARWTHSAGIDTHPSFGITVSEDRSSVSCCFGCSPDPRSLEKLLHNIFIMSGEYPKEAAKILALNEVIHDATETELSLMLPDLWLTDTSYEQNRTPTEPLPPRVLNLFPILQKAKGITANNARIYLEGRDIPEWVFNMFGVRFDLHRKAVAFPLTDAKGRIYMLRERATDAKKMWTVNEKVTKIDIDYPLLTECGVWFGMHLVDWSKPVMLVEGAEDAMNIVALGHLNVVASCTSSVTDAQLAALCGSVYLLGYDKDNAGALAHSKIIKKLRKKAALFELDWSLAGVKDGGALQSAFDLQLVMGQAVLIK